MLLDDSTFTADVVLVGWAMNFASKLFWKRLHVAFGQRGVLANCNRYALIMVMDRGMDQLRFKDHRQRVLQRPQVIQRDHGMNAEPSREYTMSPGPIRHYTASVPTTLPPMRTAPPIIVLYEALQTATSPLAEASPLHPAQTSFGLAPNYSELQGAPTLPAAARQKESFETQLV
eukprot:g5141.t1